jgi:hypothetical protein
MKESLKIKSHLPPASFELDGKYWIACGAQWVEVERVYSSEELKTIWVNERDEYRPIVKPAEKIKNYKVKGSGNITYVVKNKNGNWSCNCPASTFRRGTECKHVAQIKNQKL